VFEAVTSCRIEVPEGSVTVEGVDGPDAWLDLRGPGRSEGGTVDTDALVVERHDGVLVVRTADPRRRTTWLARVGRVRVVVHLRLPRSAALEVETVDAPIRTSGCQGGQALSTVTGEVDVREARGAVSVRTVSGPAAVEGAHLDVRAATTSGHMRVHGSPIDGLQLRSVSGRIEIEGRFAAHNEHRAESLSGSVTVRTPGGASLEVRTVSGRLIGEGAVRRVSDRGAPVLVAGDGTVPVSVTTVSGDVRLIATAAASVTGGHAAPAGGDPLLEALEALARGEISVEEADRRLEVLHG
jgi:hypothetical protein